MVMSVLTVLNELKFEIFVPISVHKNGDRHITISPYIEELKPDWWNYVSQTYICLGL
jgi:hypothetical protein